MPIYEYACKNCDHRMDALQKMSDEPLVDCPECGTPQLNRMVSAPKFRLKGQGWYETDFKQDNQRNLSKSDSEPAKSEKSDSKSGTGKGAEKSDTKATGTSTKKEKSDT